MTLNFARALRAFHHPRLRLVIAFAAIVALALAADLGRAKSCVPCNAFAPVPSALLSAPGGEGGANSSIPLSCRIDAAPR